MELSSSKLNTHVENRIELSEERQPTAEQVKRFCREVFSRIAEPFSTDTVKEMPREQRNHIGVSMAETAINITRQY